MPDFTPFLVSGLALGCDLCALGRRHCRALSSLRRGQLCPGRRRRPGGLHLLVHRRARWPGILVMAGGRCGRDDRLIGLWPPDRDAPGLHRPDHACGGNTQLCADTARLHGLSLGGGAASPALADRHDELRAPGRARHADARDRLWSRGVGDGAGHAVPLAQPDGSSDARARQQSRTERDARRAGLSNSTAGPGSFQACWRA